MSNTLRFLVFTLALLWTHSAAAAPNQIYVSAPDGVKVAVQEYGNPKGLEIVLVHGLDGSHLD